LQIRINKNFERIVTTKYGAITISSYRSLPRQIDVDFTSSKLEVLDEWLS